ncbi:MULTISPECIES: calcium:proton antiporter [Chromobacterium]|uniref:Ionic transporter y4hA n=2 Tax=Chromobacterium TaxID=535 RepID=A0ABS3GIV9_9NEIS|nr:MULTISPECIES: ionic transporter y4hA [Chromobacterium]AXT48364.1 ionic transporter y4hA [Chromobacterium rhizoryzae]MBK0415589.1 ionic transporter y4hA [Chromobacterium haemolyticum]MBO0414991.1 ionic transporter y4hA [Chromobacterium haemolyticum]MBO0498252.1 ionic transporter y4hA [Chromobacterium haemolyticum]MDH0340461.1 ionic transporter y4hA [Chromobacterium haemolyticum]
MSLKTIPHWTVAAPLVAWAAIVAAPTFAASSLFIALLAVLLAGTVFAAVHHAEVVAHKVGEPYGTLILALAVTVIEVALIVSFMLAGGESKLALARDTIFSAIMITCNGIVGICLLLGGLRHREQNFQLSGAKVALTVLAAISVLALVLPNYGTSEPGPLLSSSQLAFTGVVSLVLYGAFVFVQTIRHRDYFLLEGSHSEDEHAPPPSVKVTMISLALLLVCLVGVVSLAKLLSPSIEGFVEAAGAPAAVVGIIIAALVLLPEGLAAANAARADRVQTSLNLALGSALASIGLTIPTVALIFVVMGEPLILGLENKETIFLVLTLLVSSMSLAVGRTTILQGIVHLVIFASFVFFAISP